MISCVALDDEPIALTIISRFCERFGEIELNTFTDPRLGLNFIKEHKPQIVMLDIEMNDISGLDLARQLPLGTLLIFTTAYANYALEGFELNAVDFLHKPFSYSRFERSLRKAEYIINARKIQHHEQTAERAIVVKVEYKNVQIPLANILYVEAMDNYVRIHRLTDRAIVSQITMKALIDMLPDAEFTRIHKSYIVSLSRIKSFTRTQVVMINDVVLPVGRSYANMEKRIK